MEKLEMKKLQCQAKVVGTIVTVGGAMLMTLYKGSVVHFPWTDHHTIQRTLESSSSSEKDWLRGSILVIAATLAWASFFIVQVMTMRRYTAPLSLTALVCFIGTLQSIAVTFVAEHNTSTWNIGWGVNLFAAAYAVTNQSSVYFKLNAYLFSQ